MNLLSKLSVSLLTAGALMAPALSMANMAEQAPAEVAGQETPAPKIPDETRSIKSMFRTLNLSEEQKEQINPLLEERKQNFKTIHEQMQADRKALNEVTLANTFDTAKAKELSNKLGASLSDLALNRAEITAKIYHILTPEQQEKFRALQAERMKKFVRH